MDAEGEGGVMCEGWDPVASKECVEQVETMECPAEGEIPDFPSVCMDVCPWGTGEDDR